MSSRIYCVYQHSDINAVVYYVGSGTLIRAQSKNGRSKGWLLAFPNKNPIIEIIHKNLTKSEALEIERAVIQKFKAAGYPLVNKTPGGEPGRPILEDDVSRPFKLGLTRQEWLFIAHMARTRRKPVYAILRRALELLRDAPD